MPATLRLTDALADALADAVRRGVPIETACAQAGISDRQYFAWLKAAESGVWIHGDPVAPESLESITRFAHKIARARAEHMAQMVASIQECAVTPNAKTGLPDWRAADAMLSKHPVYRKLWHEERHLQVEGQQTVLHELKLVKALEPEAIEAAYQALDALSDAQA